MCKEGWKYYTVTQQKSEMYGKIVLFTQKFPDYSPALKFPDYSRFSRFCGNPDDSR